MISSTDDPSHGLSWNGKAQVTVRPLSQGIDGPGNTRCLFGLRRNAGTGWLVTEPQKGDLPSRFASSVLSTVNDEDLPEDAVAPVPVKEAVGFRIMVQVHDYSGAIDLAANGCRLQLLAPIVCPWL